MNDNTYKIICVMQNSTSITEYITAFAAFVAVVIAGIGLYTWKMQLKGTAKYDIARKLSKSIYNVKYAIEALRSRYISATIDESPQKINFIETHKIAIENVYRGRLEYLNKMMVDFEGKQLDAEIIIKNGIDLIGDKFRRLVKGIESEFRLYIELHSMSNIENDYTFKILRTKILANIKPEEDGIGKNISEILKDYHNLLDRHL